MAPRLKVAVLFGGRSAEHEVSVRSAESVAAALLAHHDILPVLLDKRGRWFLQERLAAHGGTPVFLVPGPDEGQLRCLQDAVPLARADVFFPVLHGPFGEDGTVQGLFELAGVAYVGAGVAASAAGMDKELMKALFAQAGLPQVRYAVLRQRDPAAEAAALASLGLPLFVKPANLGSSVAVSKVKSKAALAPALELAFAQDRKVVLETAVVARELEISILGNAAPLASVPGEVRPDREFYDYDSKYSPTSQTALLVPAPLPAATADAARALALRAFRAIDACGLARVDFFLEAASGLLLVNEINTLPGFTSISMYPKLFEASGLAYPELLRRLVALALERHAGRARASTGAA